MFHLQGCLDSCGCVCVGVFWTSVPCPIVTLLHVQDVYIEISLVVVSQLR